MANSTTSTTKGTPKLDQDDEDETDTTSDDATIALDFALNRLADLLWLLARQAEALEASKRFRVDYDGRMNVVKAADGVRLLQAYRTNDAQARAIVAVNRRFAENATADGKQVPVPGRTVRGAEPLETTCRERIGESGFNK